MDARLVKCILVASGSAFFTAALLIKVEIDKHAEYKKIKEAGNTLPPRLALDDYPWWFSVACSIFFFVWALTCVLVPVAAKVNGVVDCDAGLPWEYHVLAWCVMMLGSCLEIGVYASSKIKPFGMKVLFKSFAVGTLIKIDLYNDIVFPFVASSCEGMEAVVMASVILLFVGIFCCQWLCSSYFGMFLISSKTEDDQEEARTDWFFLSSLPEMVGWKLVSYEMSNFEAVQSLIYFAVTRCFCEDLGQNILKVCFLASKSGHINMQVVVDICLSMLFSVVGCFQGIINGDPELVAEVECQGRATVDVYGLQVPAVQIGAPRGSETE